MSMRRHTVASGLSASDHYLLNNLKSRLPGNRFPGDEEPRAATGAWVKDQTEVFSIIDVDNVKEILGVE